MRQSLKFAMCVVVSAALGLGTAAACFDDDGGGVATPTVLPATIAAPTEEPDPTSTPSPAMTLEIKVGQLVMSGMSGTTADEAAALVREYHIGNLALLGANAGEPEDVRALTSGLQALAIEANGVGMLLSIDQEGGRVIRLDPPFVQMPAAAVIGCIGETQFARQAGLVTGREMRAVGINMNLAPDADVLTNPENEVIGDRAFGTTPDVVTPMVLAYIEGLHQAGALATVKHFPGHGSTDGAGGDSHDGRVVVAKTLAELEGDDLPPFRAAAATTDLMMTSNVDYTTLDPAGIPASLSALTIAFLRNGVGFQGVIITDALEMGAVSNRWDAGEAAVRAIEAGADMALYASADGGIAAAEALLAAVQGGRISEARIDESVSRVLALKGRALGVPAPGIDVVGSAEHTAFVELLGTAALERGC